MSHTSDLLFTVHKLGRHDLALEVIKTLGKTAFHYEQYDELAEACFKLKEYILGIEYAEAAMSNGTIDAHKRYLTRCNLINLYNHANYPEKALRLITANEAVVGESFDSLTERAFSLYLSNRKDEAEVILRKLLEWPDLTDEQRNKLLFNLGTYELYRDNFLEGLSLFILEGRKMGLWPRPKYSGEEWEGRQPVNTGETIAIVGEAGIGDEIINIRFLHHLKERGFNPVYVSERKDIRSFVQRMGFTTYESQKQVEGVLWCFAMILPVYLGLEYKDLWNGPYLSVNPKLSKLNLSGNKKLAIRWQGNPEYDHDLHRNVALKEIYPAIPDTFTKYSLQKDHGLNELNIYSDITNLDSAGYLGTFEDTLNVLSEMDVVVTTCTSVAHASAALGKRTFIFVPISAYYIWSHSMEQSPWYGDNVTILRQIKPRCWKEPIAKLQEMLCTY